MYLVGTVQFSIISAPRPSASTLFGLGVVPFDGITDLGNKCDSSVVVRLVKRVAPSVEVAHPHQQNPY